MASRPPINPESLTPMSEAEVEQFVATSHWQTATSMPEIPHQYTLRHKAPDELAFLRFSRHIRRTGYKAKFGKTVYTYLDVGPYQYWTMGFPEVLINRAIKKP